MTDQNHFKQRLKTFSERLPDDAKDEYYDSPASRLDTIIGGDSSHYIRLRKVKEEYDQLADAVPVGQGFLTFYDYVKEYYGIKMEFDGGEIKLGYQVIDDKKYTVFLLKFPV